MQKILFICGSIEPGHDGVGDYTRVLAGELISRGIQAKIIALRDRSVGNHLSEMQSTRGQDVEVIRLGRKLPLKEAQQHYRRLVGSFEPEWISLQYVPYAYSQKGIPFYLPGFLELKNLPVKWHLMIHEAYVWDDLGMKLAIVGRLQQIILKNLITKLNPRALHTSIPWYAELVGKIARTPEILPLFSNIDVVPPTEINSHSEFKIEGVFFGAGPKVEYFQIFSEKIKTFLATSNKELNIVFCGKPDFRTTLFIKHLKNKVEHTRFRISELGPQNVEKLSVLFQSAHFGISREVPRLMGKSGAILAMYEHGLPIWVPLAKNEDELRKNAFAPQATFVSDINQLQNSSSSEGSNDRLTEVATQFLNSVQ